MLLCNLVQISVVFFSKNWYKKRTWVYPNVESVKPPVLHSDDLPIPVFSGRSTASCDDVEILEGSDNQTSSIESEFEESSSTDEGFSQEELNYFVRDLNLSKKFAEILSSRLKEKHCLQPDFTITSFRTTEQDLLPYFTEEDKLAFCNNVPGFLNCMGNPEYKPKH